MKKIRKMVCHIDGELEGACNYAEKKVIYKNTNPAWSKMYGDMAAQELVHADYLHKMGEEFMKDVSWIPEEDKEMWEKCGAALAEKTALVKMMLAN